jgi:hypothetical protein
MLLAQATAVWTVRTVLTVRVLNTGGPFIMSSTQLQKKFHVTAYQLFEISMLCTALPHKNLAVLFIKFRIYNLQTNGT